MPENKTSETNQETTNSDLTEDGYYKINVDHNAILKNGYYEVNGVKFSEYYYNRLWDNGRPAPSIFAKEILDSNPTKIPDPEGKSGYFEYKTTGWSKNWEMIYNPTTKEVYHIQPIKKK